MKGWHLATASRQSFLSGVIPDNNRLALCIAAFMLPNGRCLNSLPICIKKQNRQGIILKAFNERMNSQDNIIVNACQRWI